MGRARSKRVRLILTEIAKSRKWWTWDELTDEVNRSLGVRGASKMTVIKLVREFHHETRFNERHLREIRFI